MDGLGIAASLSEMRQTVEGAFIQTVYQPARDLFVVHLSGIPEHRLLISPKDAAIQLTSREIPNPQTPSGFAMLLRKHLRGGRVVGLRQRGRDRVVVLEVERRDGLRRTVIHLVAELVGLRGNLLLVQDGLVLGASRRDDRNRPGGEYRELEPQAKLDPAGVDVGDLARLLSESEPPRAMAREIDGIGRETAEDILRTAQRRPGPGSLAERVAEELGEVVRLADKPEGYVDSKHRRATFYPMPEPSERVGSFFAAMDRLAADGVPDVSEATERRLRGRILRMLGRHERTAERLREWLAGSAAEDRLRREADLLLIHRSELPSSSSEVGVIDPSSGVERRIRLDPSLTPTENAQRLHRRAKRLRRGRPQVEARLARIEREIVALRGALESLDAGGEVSDGVTELVGEREERRQRERTPSRRQFMIDGFTVLVGRSARENDELLREAAPDDVWMHARGVAGSHVIVRRGGRRDIPIEVLRKAAALAAHHSKARGERRVDVTVAAAKRVRKPKSATPGLAIVEGEDTLTVEPGLREWE